MTEKKNNNSGQTAGNAQKGIPQLMGDLHRVTQNYGMKKNVICGMVV